MSRNQNAATRKSLLYLSINDGSDTRINKEIATLRRVFDIDFIGVAESNGSPFIAREVRKMVIVRGRRRALLTLAKLAWHVFRLRCRNRYDAVHVINENLYLLLWPVLLGRPVVLDIFDSIFLKTGLPAWLLRLGQRLCYALPVKVIVTDEERAALMPAFVWDKMVVLPNYPFKYAGPHRERDPSLLRILYVGSLSEARGTALARRMIESAADVRVIMAGWLYDEPSKELARHPQVEWLGTIPQAQIIEQATRCDFILCHYEPINTNNIFASPNKIYDAIQARTAVLINPEVNISRFVREHNLGVVLEAYEPTDLNAALQSLRDFKANYRPNPQLPEKFLWDNIEHRLLEAHGVTST